MAKSPDAWMPLYIGDYLGATQRLTTEQHGAYLLLIIDYWRNGPPPDDDEVLRQITRLGCEAWANHRPAIERMFQVEGGEWRHRRIDAELENAKENADRRADRARKAADARWNATSNAQSIPQAMPNECPPPSPSPEPKGSSSVAKATSPRSSAPNVDCPDDVSESVWRDFTQLRKAKRAKLTETALAQIRSQARIAGWTLQAALEECCARGWQGFKAEWIREGDRNGQWNGNRGGAGKPHRRADEIDDAARDLGFA